MLFRYSSLCGKASDEVDAVISAPSPPDILNDWIDLKKNPYKSPVLRQTIVVSTSNSTESKEITALQDENSTIVLNIDDAPDIQDAFDEYVENQWTPWSENEKLRRFTIGMYEDLFRFQHHSTEQVLELVVGMGILRWKNQGANINYPLITKTIEAVLDPESKTITIYPTDRAPKSEIEFLQHFNVSNIADIEEHVNALLMDMETEINPCPSGCYRVGGSLGQSYRSVGFPPRCQEKNKYQCIRKTQNFKSCENEKCGVRVELKTGEAIYNQCSHPAHGVDHQPLWFRRYSHSKGRRRPGC